MVSPINTTALSGYQGNGVSPDRSPIRPGGSNSPGGAQGKGVDWFRERERDLGRKIGEGIDRVIASGEMRLKFVPREDRKDIMMRVIQKRTGRLIREILLRFISGGPVIIHETV